MINQLFKRKISMIIVHVFKTEYLMHSRVKIVCLSAANKQFDVKHNHDISKLKKNAFVG